MRTVKLLMIGDTKIAQGYIPADTAEYHFEPCHVPAGASSEEIIAAGQGCEFAVVDSMAPFEADAIKALTDMKMIHVQGVGFQGVDVNAAKEAGIAVCNCRAVNAGAVAEHAVMLMLECLRNAVEGDKVTREGRQIEVKEGYMKSGEIKELSECTVGLLGFGAIAKMVAKFLKAFGARVLYYDVFRAPEEVEKELCVTNCTLDEMLPQCDIVSVHVPVFPSTVNMVNAEFLHKMPKGSFLVNTARGEIVDTLALLDALKEGQLCRAGLDVIAGEPIKTDNAIFSMHDAEVEKKLILTPHIAGITGGTFRRSEQMVKDAIAACLAGEKPANIVNA